MIPIRRKSVQFRMRSNVVAIDVDGTLVVRGRLNTKLVEWCEQRRAEGKSLMLWSARGKDYAQTAAENFNVAHLFDVIVGKPEAIVDDKGWSWIKYSPVVRSLVDEEEDVASELEADGGNPIEAAATDGGEPDKPAQSNPA